MDNLDFLDSPEGENAETQPEEQPTEEAQAEPEAVEVQEEQPSTDRPRDEHGRFKKKEEEPVMVPLQALHETRDKVKALESELMQLRQPQQQPQSQVPDMFENPEAYTAYIQSQITAVSQNDRLNLSEEMVRQQVGDDVVNAAQQWGRDMLANAPGFAQIFYSQRNPYGFLVQQYQRRQMVSQIGDDPKEIEAYLAWKQAQAGQAPNPQTQSPPPRSIASATSAGGVQHTAVGPGVAFDEVFKG